MARTKAQPKASAETTLQVCTSQCPGCHRKLWAAYVNHRTVRTLAGVQRLHLHIQRCPHRQCARYHHPFRPEAVGRWALPEYEFG